MPFINAPPLLIKSVAWSLDRPSQVNMSAWTGTRILVANPWHGRWSAHVDLATIQGEANFRKIRSFFARMRGSLNTFRIYATAEPQNSNSGVTLSANALAGANQISITGAATPLSDGQFFTLNGQLCCCVADQSGGLVTFEPALRQAAANGTLVITSQPYALVYLNSSKFQWQIGEARQFGLAFDVEEAINEADGALPEGAGPPVLTSATASATSGSAATLGVTTDTGNGTLYWTVDTFASTPTSAQVKAGQDYTGAAAVSHGSQAVSATGAQSVSASGLSAVTTYYAHFAQENSMLGISVAISSSSFTTTGIAAPTATATMTQLASANRVYQRSTTTGGGQSKGQGTIPVAFSAVTVAGTVHARCSSGGGTRGDLQAEFAAATIGSTGAQTINIAGVDARLGWFYLDILDSAGTWQNGTVLVGMGRIIAGAGQSQQVRNIKDQDSQAATITSLSVTIDPNCSVYASYNDNLKYGVAGATITTPVWAAPATASAYDSTFLPELLRLQVAKAGVNCAFAAHARGSQLLSAFVSAGTEVTPLQNILSATGGFEAFYLWIGGNDALSATPYATFQSELSTFYSWLASNNTARGSSFGMYVLTAPNYAAASSVPLPARAVVQQAARDWCVSNNGTNRVASVEIADLIQLDGVHQTQAGAIAEAHHVHRATLPALGGANDDLCRMASATRSSGSKNIVISVPSAGLLTQNGTPGLRFSISGKGGTSQLAIASMTMGTNQITATLTSLPDDRAPLDLYFDYAYSPANDGSANMIYNAVSDGDGTSPNRALSPTYNTPVAIAAPVPASAPTLTNHGMTSNAIKFGYGMGGGYATAAATDLGDNVVPASNEITVDFWFSSPNFTAFGVLFQASGIWFGIGTDGKLTGTAGQGGMNGTTVLTASTVYHFRLVIDAASAKVYLNGTLEISGAAPAAPGTGTFVLGAFSGGSSATAATIAEFFVANQALNSGNFTPPTAAWTGSESYKYSLYHLNSGFTAS